MARKNPLNTPETRENILARLSAGEWLEDVCVDIGIPRQTVLGWRDTVDGFGGAYARAREDGYDSRARLLTAPALDRVERLPNGQVDPASVSALKLQDDNTKWVLARWSPKRYGDRTQTEISGPDGGAVQVEHSLSDAEILARFAGKS